MRDCDGNVDVVETVEEFIDKFEQHTWEFNYISDKEIDLLMSWLHDYIKVKPKCYTIKLDITPEEFDYREKLWKLTALSENKELYDIEANTKPTLSELYEKLK